MTAAVAFSTETDSTFAYTPEQLAAIDLACTNRVSVVTGGAGSGKTTVIRAIIDRLRDTEERIVLCAPTGKAAARITEASGYKASTVHSACGFFPVEGQTDVVGINENSVSPARTATTLLIDEASMLDDSVLAAVCNAVPPECRLILVGDPNQLPPVGAGYPFRDLIASGTVPHAHLTVCHRQDGKLLNNCYAILAGKPDDLVYDAGKGNRADADWSFIRVSDAIIGDTLAALFTGTKCQETFGVPPEEILVLTPLNRGACGRVTLNRIIQKAYHESHGRRVPEYKKTTRTDKWGKDKEVETRDEFVVGDRVIWTKNDRIQQLVNGDTGVVKAVGKNQVVVQFDGHQGEKTIDASIHLQLAWVLTCHKAQGSQYRKVLVIQSGDHASDRLSNIVNRSWLYTAATRSKKATFFLGSVEAFKKSVNTPAVDRRQTYLSQLLGV